MIDTDFRFKPFTGFQATRESRLKAMVEASKRKTRRYIPETIHPDGTLLTQTPGNQIFIAYYNYLIEINRDDIKKM